MSVRPHPSHPFFAPPASRPSLREGEIGERQTLGSEESGGGSVKGSGDAKIRRGPRQGRYCACPLLARHRGAAEPRPPGCASSFASPSWGIGVKQVRRRVCPS